MNQKAVVENREYHPLTGQEQFVLCEDGNGSKFVCPEELPSRAPAGTVGLPSCGKHLAGKISFFLSLFRGAERKDEFCRDVVGIYPMLEDDRTWLLALVFLFRAGCRRRQWPAAMSCAFSPTTGCFRLKTPCQRAALGI